MNDSQRRARDRAVDLIQHYFEVVARGQGIQWDGDSRAELAEAVDAIIEAATPPAISEHAQRVEPLLGGGS